MFRKGALIYLCRTTDKGFTLVELLVALAIIAALACLLLPVFVAARRDAGKVSCLSNLKQLTAATTLYLQDNENRYPHQPEDCVRDWGEPTSLRNWARALQDYTRDSRVPECPSSKRASCCRADCPMLVQGVSYPISYLGNGRVFQRGLNTSSITRPSETILYQCGGQTWNICWLAPAWNEEQSEWQSYSHRSWCVHNEGTNVGFADAHVKWIAYRDLASRPELFDAHKQALGCTVACADMTGD